MKQSRRIAKQSFHSRKEQSSRESPGGTSRRRKTTKSLAVPNLSFPGRNHPGIFSLWSRTQRSTRQRADGGTLSLIRRAKLGLRRISKSVFRATRLSKN